METAGGVVVLHPAGTVGGDIHQLVVVGGVLVLHPAEVAGNVDVLWYTQALGSTRRCATCLSSMNLVTHPCSRSSSSMTVGRWTRP